MSEHVTPVEHILQWIEAGDSRTKLVDAQFSTETIDVMHRAEQERRARCGYQMVQTTLDSRRADLVKQRDATTQAITQIDTIRGIQPPPEEHPILSPQDLVILRSGYLSQPELSSIATSLGYSLDMPKRVFDTLIRDPQKTSVTTRESSSTSSIGDVVLDLHVITDTLTRRSLGVEVDDYEEIYRFGVKTRQFVTDLAELYLPYMELKDKAF